MIDDTETHECCLSAFVKSGRKASSASRHADAAEAFAKAHEMSQEDPYLIQQWALATYKSKSPSEEAALRKGLEIIDSLKPETSNDPETLGITGAMHKRLWILRGERVCLEKAVSYYGRGFEVRRDYYNGENLATCLDYRSKVQHDPAEQDYDRKTASKVRELIIANLEGAIEDDSFEERTDQKWVFATLANCSFALGNKKAGDRYEAMFLGEHAADWEVETYDAGKVAALEGASRDARGRLSKPSVSTLSQ